MATHHGFEFRRPGLAGTGTEAPTTDPAHQPETRKDHDSTGLRDPARRKIILLGGFGAVTTIGLGSWGLAELFRGPNGDSPHNTTPNTVPSSNATAERRGDFQFVPRVFETELRRDQIKPPETLNPNTWEEVFANPAQALQYAVNYDDPAWLDRVVPGTTDGYALQPYQLKYRAAFLSQMRKTFGHDKPADDPDNTNFLAWGLTVRLDKQLNHVGGNPMDFSDVTGDVTITFGDYRPVQGGPAKWQIEKPQSYQVRATMTRYRNIATAEHNPDNGWMFYQIGFPRLPQIMEQTPPPGFHSPPDPLYLG